MNIQTDENGTPVNVDMVNRKLESFVEKNNQGFCNGKKETFYVHVDQRMARRLSYTFYENW